MIARTETAMPETSLPTTGHAEPVRASIFPSLPPEWWKGKTPAQVRRIIEIESIPNDQLVDELASPTRTERGYVVLHLGRAHPLARANGQQYLHRYVKMRELGRVLESCEHVHHLEIGCDLETRAILFAAKDTTNPHELELMIDTEHGHYHWYWHGSCEGRCRRESELEAEAQEAADRYVPNPDVGDAF